MALRTNFVQDIGLERNSSTLYKRAYNYNKLK